MSDNSIEETLTISNKLGLHARAAAKLVSVAAEFTASIEVEKDNRRINGKSIMGVMMLAASQGSNITLYISGEDADAAIQKLRLLVTNRFGEEE